MSIMDGEFSKPITTVNEAITINGVLIAIGPEKRFDSIDQILEFFGQYPQVRTYFKERDGNLRVLLRPQLVPKKPMGTASEP